MSTKTETVAIAQSDGRYNDIIPHLVELAHAKDLIGPGDSVLIKPNLHAPQHWTTGGTTSPALVAALIDFARGKRAGRILVADSPFRGNPRPEEAFTATGMADAVEEKGAEWAVVTQHDFRILRNASPDLPPELGISEFVFQFDRLINVAVMKTHIDCLVSLGMKNLKGCIRNQDKRAFHSDLDIDRAIVALNKLVRPDMTIVDGTLGMEGLGPGAGEVANFGYIFAGKSTAAVDVIAALAMGVEIDDARTLKLARDEGMVEMESIQVVGEPLEGISRHFERPYEAMARELPRLRLQSDGACSACKLNVIRALRDIVRAGEKVPECLFVIGNAPPAARGAVLIGKCTDQHRTDQPHLPGCPPRLDKIKSFVSNLYEK